VPGSGLLIKWILLIPGIASFAGWGHIQILSKPRAGALGQLRPGGELFEDIFPNNRITE
jgi:hypothetical protein